MSQLSLTVLTENSAPEQLSAEHGLSIHLNYEGHSLLLDAGQSHLFADNARRLGVDLSAVELAFLSHGHFDHSDGFPAFFACNSSAPVLARPAVLEGDWHGDRYIGLAPDLLKAHSHRFDLADGPRRVLQGVWLIPDRVAHEQSLVFETEKGLVILNSCCHAGADEVVRCVLAHFPHCSVRALIGGFHLMGPQGVSSMGPSREDVLALGGRLFGELRVAQVWTGHCTGAPAFSLLREAFPHRVNALTTGLALEF